MTECERIIEQGILPEAFFNEEEQCGFLVTEKRKKIWAIELDIYLELAKVCKKHNLTFWGDGGTLLGAIRHNGFIPWDDDMDIIMPREDYNKLLKIGPQEFNHPYFLQTPYSDPGFVFSYTKLRNSNTSCISKWFAKGGFNQGIHIDIFPLDYINLDKFEEEKAIITECIMKNSSYMRRNSVDILEGKRLENYKKYQTDDPIREYETMQRIASNPDYKGSEYVANCIVTALKSSAQIWKASWFDKTITHKFETIEIPMPYKIDERLKTQYGNYMEFPPIEQRGNWHSDIIWDPDRSYTEYV